MEPVPDWAKAARARWTYTGRARPPFAKTPAEGQRSVWELPRPPAIEAVDEEVIVRAAEVVVARTRRCLRVLETASPPTYYIPFSDVDMAALSPGAGGAWCEWKGESLPWDLALPEDRRPEVGWSYPDPFPEYARLREHIAFYAGRVDCWVGDVRAEPQPGGYYGGWVTPEWVGPFKGAPGVPAA